MKHNIKNFVLPFLCFINVIVFDIIGKIYGEVEKTGTNFQTLGNVFLLVLGSYSVYRVAKEMRGAKNNLYVYCIDTCIVTVCAFVLNIFIFDNNVERIGNLFCGWHVVWLGYGGIFLLWITGVGKEICERIFSIIINLVKCVEECCIWVSNQIRDSHKGVLFAILLGAIFSVGIWSGQKDASIEGKIEVVLMGWIAWFVIVAIVFSFVYLQPQIKQAIGMLNPKGVARIFMLFLVGLVSLFVITKELPLLFIKLGNILFVLGMFFLFGMIIYWKKEILQRYQVEWKDVIVVVGVMVSITFILLPIIGGMGEDENGALMFNESEMSNLKTYMELMVAGLELIRTLVM